MFYLIKEIRGKSSVNSQHISFPNCSGGDYQMKVFGQNISFMVIVIGLIMAGCASKGVAPVESITSAELVLKEAQGSSATIYAPLELKLAEDKLNAAKAAVEKEEFIEAKRLADEALMDARLAEAKSLSEKAKKQTQEMRDSVEMLRREIERSQK
jgi:hypothetical protein